MLDAFPPAPKEVAGSPVAPQHRGSGPADLDVVETDRAEDGRGGDVDQQTGGEDGEAAGLGRWLPR